MKRNQPFLILVAALTVAAMACNMPAAQPPATETEAPTEAPTEVSTQEPEAVEPTEAPTEAVPVGVTVSVTTATNCRTGPDAAYQLLMTVQPGSSFDVVGKYTPLNYWIINMPTEGTCWLWGKYATTVGDTSTLPEIAAPAPPPVAQVDPNSAENSNDNNSNENSEENSNDSGNDDGGDQPLIPIIPIIPAVLLPSPPANINVNVNCDFNFPTMTQTSVITWSDTGSETGYIVYKNGAPIANLGPNATNYIDVFNVLLAPGSKITYGVQTVIGSAKSSATEKTVNACN